SSRRRHTRWPRDWSSDVCSSDLRCKVFDKFPRTNLPDYFPSWGEYENYVKLLVKTNSIDNAKKIWWDIRPHPFFDTLEFRVCDRSEEHTSELQSRGHLVCRLLLE